MGIRRLSCLAIAIPLLVVSATSAFAAGGSLFLAWDDCMGEAGAVCFKDFDCTSASGPARLYTTYRLNTEANAVVTLSAVLDVYLVNYWDGVPDFWHFEEIVGCNAGFLSLTDARPSGRCRHSATTLCLATGGQCSDFITSYGVGGAAGLQHENRARILVSLARAASLPVNLAAANHYGFELDFDPSNSVEAGGACAGCAYVVQIALNLIVLEGALGQVGGESIVDIIASDMPGSEPGVCVNSPLCPVPTRNKTWGQLKALYR